MSRGPDFPGQAWQTAADLLVSVAEAKLWSPQGRDALEWLRGRGLADHTIRMFRLGFISDRTSIDVRCLEHGKIRAERGITIPWVAPGAWYGAGHTPEPIGPDDDDCARADGEGCGPVDEAGRPIPRWCGVNVRRLMVDVFEPWPKHDAKGKCRTFDGSRRGYAYPYDDPTRDHPVLIVEGEPDALIAFQEIGHIVDVVTVGSANQSPRPEALAALSECSAWLIATDYDAAGNRSAEKWWQRGAEKARRTLLPFGKDINDYRVQGGDLREWIVGELRRFGIRM